MPNCQRGLILLLGITSLVAGEVRLDVPFVRQEKNGCGAASAAMVLQYWAVQHPGLDSPSALAAAVRQQLYVTDARGVPLADARRYFEERGFHSFALRATWADVEDHLSKGRPLIVCLRKSPKADLHYVVVVGLDARRVWLNDPAKRSPSTLGLSKFDKRWELADRWVLLAVPRAKPAE